MKRMHALAIAATLSLAAAPALAQTHPEYVKLPGRIQGALYRPDSGPAPHIAFIIANGGSDIMGAVQCRELAARGFVVFCQNTVLEGNGMTVRWDDSPADFKDTVPFLKKQPGITKVILFGHSGGGTHMSYFQAVAEAGPAFCQASQKLSKCSDRVAGLTKADGLILIDSHPGFATSFLREHNPSLIVDGDNPAHVHVDPALDPFSAANGFNPDGATHYSKDFVTRYSEAQSATENALIDQAQKIVAAKKAGTLTGPLGDLMIIPGGGNGYANGAALSPTDYDIPHTMVSGRPEKLIRNDGTVVTEIVHSAAVPDQTEFETVKRNPSLSGVKFASAETFLSQLAIRSKNSLDGIDWCASNTSVTCNVEQIHVPTLIMAMGAYKFIGDTEREYDHLAATDKDYVIVEGALHGYVGCKPCEKAPGQYSNSLKNMFDYIRDWANKRFPA